MPKVSKFLPSSFWTLKSFACLLGWKAKVLFSFLFFPQCISMHLVFLEQDDKNVLPLEVKELFSLLFLASVNHYWNIEWVYSNGGRTFGLTAARCQLQWIPSVKIPFQRQLQDKTKSSSATIAKCFTELLKRCAFVMYPYSFFSLHLESGRTTEYGSLVLCITTVWKAARS